MKQKSIKRIAGFGCVERGEASMHGGGSSQRRKVRQCVEGKRETSEPAPSTCTCMCTYNTTTHDDGTPGTIDGPKGKRQAK